MIVIVNVNDTAVCIYSLVVSFGNTEPDIVLEPVHNYYYYTTSSVCLTVAMKHWLQKMLLCVSADRVG